MKDNKNTSPSTEQISRLNSGVGTTSLKNSKLSEAEKQPNSGDWIGVGTKQETVSGGSSTSSTYVQPMVETAYADRLHYAEKSIASSDGNVLVRIKQVKTIKFKDSASIESKKKTFIQEFKEKPATTPP